MAEDEKKKLYRRIAGANPHLVLQRMRVHGFWPVGVALPTPPPEEVEERRKIDAELDALRARSGGKTAKLDAEEELRKERKRRWEVSRKRRSEKKKLREARAAERRAQWE